MDRNSKVRSTQNNSINQAKPILSIALIIAALFTIVFFQMEERRLSYSILKLNRELKKTVEARKLKAIQLSRVNRPSHVQEMAQSHGALIHAQSSQIIHMSPSLWRGGRK